MGTTTEIRKGIAVVFKGQTWLVTQAQFVSPGKGSAFTRVKLKNLTSGTNAEVTYKSGEAVETADVQHKKCQFMYTDGTSYNFMDNDSFEQFSLDAEAIGDAVKLLKDGIECYAMYIDNVPVSIQLPPKMDFLVTFAEPGVKGDTATGASKDCTIETGLTIKVPLFVNEGDIIKINTEDFSYVSKAN
ncbi:MAG: elongation factor P [Candidatus Gracilibacteria bacterium]|jgi:elongation factor P